MHVIHLTIELAVPNIDEAKASCADYLGLEGQNLGLDWVTRFIVPGSGDHIQLLTQDPTAPRIPCSPSRSTTSTRGPVNAVIRSFTP